MLQHGFDRHGGHAPEQDVAGDAAGRGVVRFDAGHLHHRFGGGGAVVHDHVGHFIEALARGMHRIDRGRVLHRGEGDHLDAHLLGFKGQIDGAGRAAGDGGNHQHVAGAHCGHLQRIGGHAPCALIDVGAVAIAALLFDVHAPGEVLVEDRAAAAVDQVVLDGMADARQIDVAAVFDGFGNQLARLDDVLALRRAHLFDQLVHGLIVFVQQHSVCPPQ